MPLWMALGGQSMANGSCTPRVNLYVKHSHTPSLVFFLTRQLQGNVVVARELARRYGDKIVSTSLNPGNIHTDLLRHSPMWLYAILVRFFSNFGGT